MREYVLILPKKNPRSHSPDDVLLILKDKPAFQKGRLNLVGGKVEPGEHHFDAAVRELKEEAGFEAADWMLCGKMVGKSEETIDKEDWIIWCYRCDLINDAPINPRDGETENVAWYRNWQDKRLMPNLKLIIPLLMMGVQNWAITNQTKELEFPYEITLELN